jgi:hypothetical protein
MVNGNQFGVLALKETGIVGQDDQPGVAAFGAFQCAIRLPRGILLERISGGVLESGQLDLVISPNRVDQPGPHPVSVDRNQPDQGSRVNRNAVRDQCISLDEKPLSGLQIKAYLDGQFGVFFQGLLKV